MKKPYEIIENVDGTLTLRVADISKSFRTAKALNSFAMQLYEQVQTRQTGMFRLQDAKDGRLNLIFNKGGETIHIKDYEQAEKFAAMILADLSDEHHTVTDTL